jgi:halimadienyl-diphosphate synthase
MQKTILQLAEPAEQHEGKMSGAAYDTAWVARLMNDQGKPVFPECIQWLLINQKSDGSWGSRVLNYHDRVLSTLSAIMALKETYGTMFESQITKGENFIWDHMKDLESESCKFVSSELLLPSMMEQAESMHLNLPFDMKIYEKEYHRKLNKIDETLRYSPLTTLSHSLEFLGDSVDPNRLSEILLSNGCVGNSPAATAFLLRYRKDERGFMFLRQALQSTGDGSVMTVYPINVFEYLWTTYNLMIAGLYFERYFEICDLLLGCVGRHGVGMSTEFPVPDADDTSVLCKILNEMQYFVDYGILDAYNLGDYFATYTFELDPSVTTNIHVLDCVKSCKDFPEREVIIEKLIRFLRRNIRSDGFWEDKWHISPYYATCHAVFTLCGIDSDLTERAISWILRTKNSNGTWGKNGGTLEETAYAIQALMYYHRHVEHIDVRRLSKSLPYLSLGGHAPSYISLPDLWVGKVLYTPMRIVWSSIASAQFMGGAEKPQIPSRFPC